MDSFIMLFIIILILLLLYVVIKYIYTEEQLVKASDNNYYLLRNIKWENPELQKVFRSQSVEVLSSINGNIIKLLDYITINYPNQYWISRLNKNYKRNGNSLSEAAVENGFTSFTIDKEYMHICLRTRDSSEQLYDLNTLIYVVIHELAHMGNYDSNGNPIEGHGLQFVEKFRFLLQQAIKLGIYSYQDYSKTPKEYCGITISKNVL
jgi:hypothetical protein